MIASIASYYVGAALVEHFGVHVNFRVTSLSFMVSALCITMIMPKPAPHHAASDYGLRALANAFTYVKSHHRVLEVILISTVFWAAASVVRSIIPAIVKEVFGGSYQDIGTYQGLLGVGLLVGSLVLTFLGPALKSELAISWCFKLAGIAGMFLAAAAAFKWDRRACASFIFLIGFFGSGIQVSVYAFLQRIVPDHLRGRIFGVNDLCSMAGLLLATGLLGIPRWPNIDRHITWIMGVASLGLVTCGAWTTMVRLRRGRFGRRLTFCRNANEFYCRLMARVQRDGICTIPVSGPVIVAANHNSVLDPFVLTAGCPNRTIGFMIAREYATIPVFRKLVEAIECVPVTRSGNDTASVKAVLRHLSQGKAIGIFPQGRIQRRDEPPEIHEGVGMLALRSGATVIPCYIDGTRPPWVGRRTKFTDMLSMVVPFFQFHRARVRYGTAVDLSAWKGREKDRAAYREVAEHIMAKVMSLRVQSSTGTLPVDPAR
jgi:1-acyl-sn-glycerol-3-phosphate acyltransferase